MLPLFVVVDNSGIDFLHFQGNLCHENFGKA